MDLIVAFDVLEHIEDDLGAVEEVRRVLKASGTFLIAVPPTRPCGPRTTPPSATSAGTRAPGSWTS